MDNQVDGILDLDDPTVHFKPSIDVYLASPMTNTGKKARNKNTKICDAVKDSFANKDVADFTLYDPADNTQLGSPHSPQEVFRIDMLAVMHADLIVIIACPQSLGVGIESMIAMNASIPRVVINSGGGALSRMFCGMPTNTLLEIQSGNLAKIKKELTDKRRFIAESVLQVKPHRRATLKSHQEVGVGKKMLKHRIRCGLTRKQLSSRTAIPVEMIELYEHYDEATLMLTMLQLQMLGQLFEIPIKSFSPHLIPDVSEEQLRDNEIKSLDTLVEFVRKHNPSDDNRVLACWKSYLEAQKNAIAARNSLDQIQTVDDWQCAYGTEALLNNSFRLNRGSR